MVIPEVGNIQCNENFGDYLARIGMSEDQYTVTVMGSTSKSDCLGGSHARVPSRYIGDLPSQTR